MLLKIILTISIDRQVFLLTDVTCYFCYPAKPLHQLLYQQKQLPAGTGPASQSSSGGVAATHVW